MKGIRGGGEFFSFRHQIVTFFWYTKRKTPERTEKNENPNDCDDAFGSGLDFFFLREGWEYDPEGRREVGELCLPDGIVGIPGDPG